MGKEKSLYDIYILKTSGIPLFAGCTATDYCMRHMDQHELQSGFLAAIHSFSKETFTEENLRQILYNDIKISFKSNDEIIMAFVHPIDYKNKKIEKDLEKAWKRFHEKYRDSINESLIEEKFFDDFREDLRDLGIIPDKIVSVKEAQYEREQNRSIRKRLIQWLHSISKS